MVEIRVLRVDPYPAKLIYLNFHPVEAVSRQRGRQLQVGEKYVHLFNWKSNIYKYLLIITSFRSQISVI